jgi:4-aminobutyrate aminotransferase-like enzyme/Ser/Thr protein kinase RdoA (MazF antagonist)
MERGFDVVLQVPRPDFGAVEAAELGRRAFGVEATGATDLGSERDQTLMLTGEGDAPLAIMKVSNGAEVEAALDMEALAALHARRVDPDLPVALPWLAPGADPTEGAAAYRVRLDVDDTSHLIRMYDVLPGRSRFEGTDLDDAACTAWGETTARLGRALRGFTHPNADRTMLWDIQHALETRPFLDDVPDPRKRRLVGQVLDRFEEVVAPAWEGLRAQVVHGDLTVDNALIDERGMITAIIDFGDMSYSALAVDPSSAIDSLVGGREPRDLFRTARLILDGYQRRTPLEPEELRLMGELIAARAAVTIAITSWRAAQGLEEASFAERFNELEAATIETIIETGWDETARRLGADVPSGDVGGLAARRDGATGPALEPLSYDVPIEMASARGVWMTDIDGTTYLDAYNNVPCVGHAHPRVAEAIARRSRVLNTNMRYLHEDAIELAERLIDTCPPSLDTVLFVNSGSEANDLAWRLASAYTGNTGGLCTSFAYHGISAAIAPLSPETWPRNRQPDHIETWIPPDAYRGLHGDPQGFADALGRLAARGHAPALTMLDGVLTSDGFLDLDPAYAQALVRMNAEAGGLWVADEVQGGHGRTGDAMWSFQRHGIEPDIVTLGKPMGNGHPVAAVITRREIAARFAEDTVFFSTFGGNPVSAAAALAVLDVLEDERVLERARTAGEALRTAVRGATDGCPVIGDVRGMGLANGIEIVRDTATKEPDAAMTSAIANGLRNHGVLVGTTGPHANVLKVRPPLAFTDGEVPVFTMALERTLEDVAS